MRKSVLALFCIFAAALLAVGCGGSDNGTGGTGQGTLKVMLADAPDPTVTALDLTIGRVEALVNDQWTTVSDTEQTYDLLLLRQTDTQIGSTDLPIGTYSQIRFMPTAAKVTDSTGTYDVKIPSGYQTGVKVVIQGGYNVSDNEVTTLLLDFDVHHSLVRTGNGQYLLKPVVRGVVEVLSGTITGVVQDAGGAVSGATVDVFASSDLNNVIVSTSTQDNGGFKVWALMPGTYTLKVHYTDPETNTDETATVADVQVSADQNTDVGTVTIS